MANTSTNPSLKAQKGYSHIKSFNVAGVTFDNRQKTLKKALEKKLSGQIVNVTTEQYNYEGKPAFKILADGQEIGNIRSEDKDYILKNKDRLLGITDLYINSFKNEKDEEIYYAKIDFLVKNKNTTASSENSETVQPQKEQYINPNAENTNSTPKPIYKKWQFYAAIGAACVVFYIIAVITGIAK